MTFELLKYCQFTVTFLVVLRSKKGLIKYDACLIYIFIFFTLVAIQGRVKFCLLHTHTHKQYPLCTSWLIFLLQILLKWGHALYMIITYTAELWLFILEKRLKLKQNQRFGFNFIHTHYSQVFSLTVLHPFWWLEQEVLAQVTTKIRQKRPYRGLWPGSSLKFSKSII